jgi:hypothetical protein
MHSKSVSITPRVPNHHSILFYHSSVPTALQVLTLLLSAAAGKRTALQAAAAAPPSPPPPLLASSTTKHYHSRSKNVARWRFTEQSLMAGRRSSVAETRVEWIKAEIVNNCEACQSSFGIFRRKHHCRHCGHVFCDSCTPSQMRLPPQFGFTEPQVCHATPQHRRCHFAAR